MTPVDLDALEVEEIERKTNTDVCKVGYIQHERPVAFHEFIPNSSNSSSDMENLNETHKLPVIEEDSDLDSMPELEDEINIDSIEIPWWLIPNGVLVTFRGGRVIFKRGPPWQEVLAQMLEEQDLTAENN